MARPKLLNVREHLKHVQELIDLYDKYGDCPLFQDGLRMVSLINRTILAKHEVARAAGDRKDIRL